jgi:hypothetical protein
MDIFLSTHGQNVNRPVTGQRRIPSRPQSRPPSPPRPPAVLGLIHAARGLVSIIAGLS